MAHLDILDSIHIAAVLDDTVDQLAVLGHIMPTSFEGRPEANEIVGEEIGKIVESQKNLENQYEELIAKRAGLKSSRKDSGRLKSNEEDIGNVVGGIRHAAQSFGKTLKQSPLTTDNVVKLQEDRNFLQDILSRTLEEIKQTCSFEALVEAVNAEKSKKAEIQQTILKEEEGRKEIKNLQKQIQNIKIEREDEIQQRNQMIAHLKDQLQEMKAKTNMEGKYIQKDAEVAVYQTQKKCSLIEKQLREEIELLNEKINEEERVNQEIEQYLKTHQTELEEKVEFWMEKYDKDVEAKTHELDVLKASKANDLARLQELTKLYAEYEQVVVEDRIEKEKARRKEEQELEELKACVQLQSWWRGVMVRRQLGPYSKKKKKKGKKGKKGSGKKKGKKKK
ncbi:Dynein regulatory complex protein 9 [Holothuria leucospilota]|uniref:Dynein regulatory complex protein 9 n=1 Tax=Holothuria leucospilota TaxID=206669 RepID=A0A9Q1BKV0_HOLLE|nr:Dynein regulatory complex protein 9 [Holothuria leucospilota]